MPGKGLALTMVLLLAGTAAAAPTSENPDRLLAQAEQLNGKDDRAGLELVRQALADPGLSGARRAHADAVRCWLTVNVAIDDVETLASRDLPEVERVGDPATISDLRACRGYAREQAGDLARAAQDYEVGMLMGQRAKDPAMIAQAAVLRGELRYSIGDTSNALADLQLAYRLETQRKNAGKAAYALNAIANLYADVRVGEYDTALKYYRQLLALHQAAGDKGEEATAWFNIASTLDHAGNLDGAVDAFRQALRIQIPLGDPGETAEVRRALGVSLVKQGRTAEAMALFDQALAGFQAAKDEQGLAATRLSRAVGLRQSGRMAEANADFAVARDYFTRHANPRFLEKIEAEQALAWVAVGDWKAAYGARVAQLAHRDELAARLKREATTRMRVAFDTDRTEAENRALERENLLKQQALETARRIERLQRVVIALIALLALLLAWMIVRALRTSRRMRELALTDELTRLPNRRHVFDIADRTSSAAHQAAAPWSVLALDIDHFKSINDRFGHDAGDKVLARVAAACAKAVRAHDVVGRIGGEEFLVVLPRASLQDACEVGERIRAAVAALVHDDIQPGLRTTISVGAAQSRDDDKSAGALAKRADACLYVAKTGGRNRVVGEAPEADEASGTPGEAGSTP